MVAYRIALLSQRGGIWIDSTVFLTQQIPDDIFDTQIYNVKNISPDFDASNIVVDSTKWQSYFLAARPKSVTYTFLYNCLCSYLIHYDNLVDYFLVFYLAKYARDYIPAARMEYNLVPSNNYECELLSDLLKKGIEYSEKDFRSLFENETFVFKLSWKDSYPEYSKSGMPTLATVLFE